MVYKPTYDWGGPILCEIHGKSQATYKVGPPMVYGTYNELVSQALVNQLITARWCPPPSYKLVYNPISYRYITYKP